MVRLVLCQGLEWLREKDSKDGEGHGPGGVSTEGTVDPQAQGGRGTRADAGDVIGEDTGADGRMQVDGDTESASADLQGLASGFARMFPAQGRPMASGGGGGGRAGQEWEASDGGLSSDNHHDTDALAHLLSSPSHVPAPPPAPPPLRFTCAPATLMRCKEVTCKVLLT